MESQGHKPPYGSQTSTPIKTTSSNSSKENSVGRLTRESSIQTADRALPLRMTSEKFEAFSQQVGNISLAEAKDHLQNLGPVPTLPDPMEVINRKLVELEENKIIRRDSISFLKRRTSERKSNLAVPALKITTETARAPPVPSITIPDSATTVEMAPQILGSTSAADVAVSPDTNQSIEGQTNQVRDGPVTESTGPVGIFNSPLSPREQQNITSRAQANEPANNNVLPSSTGTGTLALPAHVSSIARTLGSQGPGDLSPPATATGIVSNPYVSFSGTTPAPATERAMGVYAWQNSGPSLPIPPVVSSQNQPVTIEWLYGVPVRSTLTSTIGSRETTPDLVYSSDGSEVDFGKRKANSPTEDGEVDHKKLKPEVSGAVATGGSSAQQ